MNGKNKNQEAGGSEEAPDIEILPPEETVNRAVPDNGSEKKQASASSGNSPKEGANAETEKLKADLEKAKKDYLYLMADFENHKKNAIKERAEYLKYGSERLIVELLEVIDNFQRALQVEIDLEKPATVESFQKGIEMTSQELTAVLGRFGVSEVKSAGEAFDPNVHEALGSEESDQIAPGHIVNVFKSPYKLHDKLIRPGQVIVAKEKSSN